MKKVVKEKKVIGWREWVSLPDLGIDAIKAKIDTGARTSSLHAFDLEYFKKRGQEYVRFSVHPVQRNSKITIEAIAPIHEFRMIRSSNGHQSERPVIITEIEMMDERWEVELTLANRDEMGFRMLLGREGIRNRVLIDTGKSFLGQKPKTSKRKTVKKG